jgi:hypothetical protein
MSLEVQNGKLQMFFEPQKQRNKVENAWRERVIFWAPLLLVTICCSFLIHFSDFEGYKCAISKTIKFVESEKQKNNSWRAQVSKSYQSTTPFILKGHILFSFH